MVVMQDQGYHTRRRPVPSCFRTLIRVRIIPPSMEESRVTVCYEIIKEYLIIIICHIFMRPVLGRVPTSNN